MRELKLKPGDPAPEFSLANQKNEIITLSSLKGKKVLLSFHPLAWTGVCEVQMKSLEIKKEDFDKANTVALGISVDSVPSKKAWAAHLNVENTHLLADFWPHGEVAEKYDLFIDKLGISGRANVLIDEKGKIDRSWVYEISQIPDIEAVLQVIKA
jgi:peroxiredoxin